MTATELRIGNYVDTGEFHLPMYRGNYMMKADWFKYSDKFKPIPLTEEWLLKFGFTITHYAYLRFHIYLLETEIYLRPSLKYWYWGFVNDDNDCEINDCYELKYVHQLQNLYFALTQKELTL